MAIGCRWAACSRRTALAETSRMQCFPWGPAGGGRGQTEVPRRDKGQGKVGTEIGQRGNDMNAKRHVGRVMVRKGYEQTEQRQREKGKGRWKAKHRRAGMGWNGGRDEKQAGR